MFAERRPPPDLDDRLDSLIRAWAGDGDLAAIYLFGSRAGGPAGPRSDVDLAVVLCEELAADARWRKRLALLADACQRRFDRESLVAHGNRTAVGRLTRWMARNARDQRPAPTTVCLMTRRSCAGPLHRVVT